MVVLLGKTQIPFSILAVRGLAVTLNADEYPAFCPRNRPSTPSAASPCGIEEGVRPPYTRNSLTDV